MEHQSTVKPGQRFWAAPDLAKADYPVFPVAKDKKKPSVEGGFYAATTDLSQIAAWIEEGKGDNDIAIATGFSSGLVVVEADTAEMYVKMEEDVGPPTVKTRRGGHWWFRHPKDGKVTSTSITEGLDRKGDGGYVLVPPSRGRTWTTSMPEKKDLPRLPEKLRGEKRKKASGPRPDSTLDVDVRREAAAVIAKHVRTIKNGKRHEHLKHLCGALLYKQRMSLEDACAVITDAWTNVGGELADRAPHEVPNTLATTEQAVREGRATGIPNLEKITPGLFEDLWGVLGWRRPDTGMSLNGSRAHKETPAKANKPDVPTHDELRDRFLSEHQEDYAFGLGEWQHYAAGFWSRVPDARVKSYVSDVMDDAKPEGIKPTASIVNSVAELAKYKVFVDDDLWDSDPDILVCANGVLHIPTGELKDHNRRYYATSAVPYNFDPKATAPGWGMLLADTVPEAHDFLQEFAGYSLTVDTSHEVALWLFGPPGSGRSTFLTGLEAMLGPRAGILGLADLERSQFALANVVGKTLMTATEQPSSFLASTNILNALISGEKIQVEKKFKDPYEITPRVKLAWAMNELPRVGDANSGIFRRVKVVSFPQIPPEKRDPEVKEHIKEEGPGILNWALEGLTRLLERGRFEIPDVVADATQQFRENNDVPGIFVTECCITGNDPDLTVGSSELYNAYKFWCEENGHRAQSSTSIATDWGRLGFKKYASKGRNRYRYVRLRLPSEYE